MAENDEVVKKPIKKKPVSSDGVIKKKVVKKPASSDDVVKKRVVKKPVEKDSEVTEGAVKKPIKKAVKPVSSDGTVKKKVVKKPVEKDSEGEEKKPIRKPIKKKPVVKEEASEVAESNLSVDGEDIEGVDLEPSVDIEDESVAGEDESGAANHGVVGKVSEESPQENVELNKESNEEPADDSDDGKKLKGRKTKERKSKDKKVKEKKPKKVKEKKPRKPKEPWSKKKKIKVGICGGIGGAVLIGLILFNALRDKNNYYTVWDKVFSTELGSFRYTIDFQSNESDGNAELENIDIGKISEMGNTDMSESDSSDEESSSGGDSSESDVDKEADVDAKEEVKEDSKFSEWTTSEGVTSLGMKYPNFKLIIEGGTMNIKKLESQFTMTLATKNFSDTLTTVIIKDGYFYFDIEQLQYWLKSSKDAYLVSLASKLPSNSKYLKVAVDDFKLLSGYSESDEHETGYINNPMDVWRNFTSTARAFIKTFHGFVGSKGMSKQDDVYSLKLNEKQGEVLYNGIKGLIRSRDLYYSKIGSARQGLMDKAQAKQYANEKDNFLSATSTFANTVLSTSDINMECGGSSRRYVDGNGAQNIEAIFSTIFTANNIDYSITLTGLRQGTKVDINVPDGSIADFSQTKLWGVIADVMEYFNPTSIDLRRKTKVSADNLTDEIVSKFVDYINTNSDDIMVTEVTARDFINRYKDFKVTDTSSEKDELNAKLVQSFYNSFQEIFADMSVKEIEEGASTDQFAKISVASGASFNIEAEYDTSKSKDKLIVIKAQISNNQDKDIQVDLRDFSMQTKSGGIYPINSEDALKEYDDSIKTDDIDSKISLDVDGKKSVYLYCVATGGLEQMNLMYNEEDLGTLITRK